MKLERVPDNILMRTKNGMTLELMKFDLENIKEGGYNAIRTWSQ